MRKGECTREKVYQYIVDFVSGNGHSPSIREIGEGVGLKSVSSVKFHVDHLVDDGRLQAINYAPRSISLVGHKVVKE